MANISADFCQNDLVALMIHHGTKLSKSESKVFYWLLRCHWAELKNGFTKYATSYHQVEINLKIDIQLLLEDEYDIGVLILQRFEKAKNFIKRIVFYIGSHFFSSQVKWIEGILLYLSVQQTVPLQSFRLDSLDSKSLRTIQERLISVTGVISTLDKQEEIMRAAVFKCKCQETISLSKQMMRCPKCKEEMKQVFPLTVSEIIQKGSICKNPCLGINLLFPTCLAIQLEQRLVGKLALGEHAEFIGYLKSSIKLQGKKIRLENIFMVNHLRRIPFREIEEDLMDTDSNVEKQDPSTTSWDFASYEQVLHGLFAWLGKDFKFNFLLCLLLLISIASSFPHNIRKGLRMILLSQGDTKIWRMIRLLLQSAGNISTSVGGKSELASSSHAGAFHFARNGILFISNLESLSAVKKRSIEKFLISSVVSHEGGLMDASAKEVLHCSIIAQYYVGNDSLFTTKEASLASSFDLVIRENLQNKEEEENGERETLVPGLETSIACPEELEAHWQRIRVITPQFSTEAKRMLRGFWMLQRKLCASISIANYSTLLQLAFSHAKLCGNEYVSEIDATMAIYFMEEHTIANFAFSVLDFSSSSVNLPSYGDSFEEQVKSLHQHISRKLKMHSMCEDFMKPEE